MLIDLAAVAHGIIGIWSSCVEEGSEKRTMLRAGYINHLPLVTVTLLRGTTALEVNAPPVHCLLLEDLIAVVSLGENWSYLLAVGAVAQGG